jgi:hypothetical protein
MISRATLAERSDLHKAIDSNVIVWRDEFIEECAATICGVTI